MSTWPLTLSLNKLRITEWTIWSQKLQMYIDTGLEYGLKVIILSPWMTATFSIKSHVCSAVFLFSFGFTAASCNHWTIPYSITFKTHIKICNNIGTLYNSDKVGMVIALTIQIPLLLVLLSRKFEEYIQISQYSKLFH